MLINPSVMCRGTVGVRVSTVDFLLYELNVDILSMPVISTEGNAPSSGTKTIRPFSRVNEPIVDTPFCSRFTANLLLSI